jgi:transcriptional regulator with XRE-family HTH domain
MKSYSEAQLGKLGASLRKLRVEKGVSAAVVAQDALGYGNGSHAAVSRLERGLLNPPRLEHLSKLAAYFGVQLQTVLPTGMRIEDWDRGKKEPSTETATLSEQASVVEAPRALPSKLPKLKSFSARVKYLRERLQLSQEAFAESLSRRGALILKGNIVSWESGAREPNPLQLHAISRLCDVQESWLLSGDFAPAATPRCSSFPFVAEQAVLLPAEPAG